MLPPSWHLGNSRMIDTCTNTDKSGNALFTNIPRTISIHDDFNCTKMWQNTSHLLETSLVNLRCLKNRLLNYTEVSYYWSYLSTKHSYFKGFRTGTTAVAGQETYVSLVLCVVLFPSRTFCSKIRIFPTSELTEPNHSLSVRCSPR